MKKLFTLFFTFITCISLINAQCDHTFRMADAFGDGWNGSSVDVTVNGVAVLTAQEPVSGDPAEDVVFSASTGDVIALSNWATGTWTSEVSWEILDGSGASIGVDRVSFIANQLKNKIFSQKQKAVVILVLDEKFYSKYYEILKTLRENKINSEIYPGGNVKLSKQFQYCDKNASPVAIIVGQEEIEKKLIKFKLIKGEKDKNEFTAKDDQLVNEIKKFI